MESQNSLHNGEKITSVDGIDVIDCRQCGYAHVQPFPSQEFYENEYKKEYYSTVWPDYFKRFEEDKEWWELAYSERYQYFESHLAADRRRILDVGSGPGYFLSTGKKRGWETLGIEPSIQAAEYATQKLGLLIRNEFLHAGTPNLGTFDAVHMSEVIEHLPDPKGMLTICHGLLRHGGLLSIVVPNDFNPIQKTLHEHMGFKPWWVAPQHHLNYFNASSLAGLLERVGFKVLHQTTTFPIDLFLLMGDNYIGNNEVGRAAQQRRKNLELNMAKAGMTELRLKWYKAMADLGLGRELVFYAKKIH
jgi:SAM-dependent methyltransferase